MREIEIDLIEPNSEQPRTRFTQSALEELAQSIRENGIVQPIVVRRKGTGYELVAGERRWRAAQLAGLNKIPSIIRQITDDRMLELALIENIQRQELNAIEEARAYKKLIETLGLTQEMVAGRVGKDRTFITGHLRLLKLPEDIQRLVEEEKISVGHARALLMAETTDLQRRVARNILDMALTVRETERTVKRLNNGVEEKQNTKSKEIDANVKAAENKLRRRFGTQIKIMPNPNKLGGKIEFEYYSDADLDRIYQLLMLNDGIK
ncbi:MAG: ParB/RepB/Spo0J family partition protein [Pyrinomonadaceae bacterium]